MQQREARTRQQNSFSTAFFVAAFIITSIASLIPPAHAAFLPLARGLVVNAASPGSLCRRLGSSLGGQFEGPYGPLELL